MPKAKVAKKTTKKAVKKTVKKVAKKTTKKTVKKAVKKAPVKALVCAQDKECFWTTDGQILKDLEQLRLAFGSMGEEVFLHHVTKEKNDFADWVEHVLADAECATDLRKAKKPSTAKAVIVRHLRLYK